MTNLKLLAKEQDLLLYAIRLAVLSEQEMLRGYCDYKNVVRPGFIRSARMVERKILELEVLYEKVRLSSS